MTKKLFSILMTIVMVISIAPVAVFAENDILSYLTYEIVDGEVTITDCDESISGEVVIPDTIEGYPVTRIGDSAFSICYSLTGIKISDGVTAIGVGAFRDCHSLVNVVISDSVTSIDADAFHGCISLESINIPDGVTYVGSSAFYRCRSLTSITIPDSVTSIGGWAFDMCESLKSVTIGNNVRYIGSYAFLGCYSLENITVDENNANYSSDEYGVLFNKDKTELIQYPQGNNRAEYTIPESVTALGEDAFRDCYGITSLTIPDSVTSVGEMAFANCDSLTSVTLPDSIISVSERAFESCDNLVSVTLGKNVTEIDIYAFRDCYRLTDITIPESVASIGAFSFSNCDSLSSVIIPDSVTEIGNAAFYECDNLTSIIIPKDVTSILDYAIGYYYEDGALKLVDDFIIYGYTGSTAQTYANENSIKFVALDACEHSYVDTVITPPTYSHAGIGKKVCEHCGETDGTYEIPMLEIEDSEEKIDKDTGVSVVFPEGTFEGEAEIEVKPVEDGEAYKLISHKEGNYKVTMFDINVTVDGENVQPNGTVLVQIPLPKGYNQNKCVVYYVADDGTMEELKTYHNKDGYVYFETDHFSYYAILEETEVTSDNNNIANDFISYLRSLLNKYIDAFLKFIDMIKSLFGMA